MSNKIKVEQGSSNIFKDLGFPDEVAEEELLKAQLGAEIFTAHSKTHKNRRFLSCFVSEQFNQ